jgi:hypothetical protein
MNITTKQIKKIIKEEIESMVDEGFFDKAKKALGFGGKKDYIGLMREFMKSPVYKEKLQKSGIDSTRKISWGNKPVGVNVFFEMALMSIGRSFDTALANTVDDVMNDPPPNFKEGEANKILQSQLSNMMYMYLGNRPGFPTRYENKEVIPSEKIKIVLDAAIEFFHEKWASGKAKFTVTGRGGGGPKTGLMGMATALGPALGGL